MSDDHRRARMGLDAGPSSRELALVENASVAIDLADKKQMVVVTDHDSKVLARKTFRCRAWDLGIALDWAADRATAKGFAGVTLSCEPTGHPWRVLGSARGGAGYAVRVCPGRDFTRTDASTRPGQAGRAPRDHQAGQRASTRR